MNITINKVKYELKYTFNSFKYMEDFDLQDISELERKPFKMIKVTEDLLTGAIYNNPDVVIEDSDISNYLEEKLNEGTLFKLLEDLMELLEESSFFKSLQVKNT